MATKQLFQILLRNRDGIKQGITKVQDIVTEYLTSTGARAISPGERFTINKEFSELAPSNVINDTFGDFAGLQKDAGDAADEIISKNVEEVFFGTGDTRLGGKTPFTDKVRQQNPGVELRGDETFGELTEKLGKPIDSTSLKDNLMQTDNPFSDLVKTTEKGPKTLDQRRADAIKELGLDKGVGSLYPKGRPGEIFDEANSKRDEMAGFMRAMRDAGIKNEDVRNTAKITDVAEGKRAATSLARAADMGADTKIKQELLGTLDEDIATNGPKFFQEEFMGYDSMGNLLENITTTVNNGIYDDLIEQGVPEDKVSEIFRYIASVRNNMKYDPKAVLRKIADDVEMEDIKYDTTFWDNYIDEILSKIQKPAPRFADGGLV